MKDEIRNILIALSSVVPYAGGTISFILDKYIPSEVERRKNEFLVQLSNDLEALKEKIDIKNLETPEFKSVFAKLLQASVEEHRQEKLVAFRNISLNLLLNTELLKFDKLEFYSRLILMLIPDEIKILHTFYLLDVKKVLNHYDDKSKPRDIYCIIERLWGEVDKEYVKALISDCSRYMLISGSPEQQKKYSRKGIFITDLGEGFVNYIFNPIEGDFYGQ